MEFGKLEKVKDLRKYWKNEAYDFTNWLSKEENINMLGNEIGIDIEAIATESKVGKFSTDIVAQDSNNGNIIVIENQLESTNHDHLGKIITYASGHDAKIIIWVVKEAQEEHRQAVDWLNEHTDSEINIFLCRIELWKIDDSKVAPKFVIVSKPNNWSKAIKRVNTSKDVTGVKLIQFNYWSQLSQYIDENSNIFNSRTPSPQHWYNLALGTSEAKISMTFNSNNKNITCGISIRDNKELFDYLYEQKEEIENELGFELDWNRLDDKKAATITKSNSINPMLENNWNSAIRWQITTAEKLFNSFSDRIKDF